MKEYASGVKSSELSLVDVPTTSARPAEVTDAASSADMEPARVSLAPGADRFLAQAVKERATGHIDQPLWVRAVSQAGGDEALATRIYLESRATALHVEKRQERAARRARVVEVLSNAPDPGFGAEAPIAGDKTPSSGTNRAPRRSARWNDRRAILMAGVLGLIVVAAGWVALRSESSPAQQPNVAKPALAASASGRSTPSEQTAVAANTGTTAGEDVSGENLVARVEALEKTGNWNLLVIYAAEWTRKEPGNPVAWKQLSQGYRKLRQFTEAMDAATRAVQLAPEDSAMWQNLGQLNTALQRLPEALVAFQRAAALNDRDVVSLVQEGIVNTQLGRLPDARIAFAKALAVSPDDVQALCGAASIAQKEGRAKDADAMTRQVTSLAGGCPDSKASESVRVATRAPAQKKLASAVGR
jgi:Flp pilus assembly protein TadD